MTMWTTIALPCLLAIATLVVLTEGRDLPCMRVMCPINPCDQYPCPAFDDAICVADTCGGCKAWWTRNAVDVTEICKESRSQSNVPTITLPSQSGTVGRLAKPGLGNLDAQKGFSVGRSESPAVPSRMPAPGSVRLPRFPATSMSQGTASRDREAPCLMMNCFADPCRGAVCPAFANDATCTPNYCGGCNPKWTLSNGNDVTETCLESARSATTGAVSSQLDSVVIPADSVVLPADSTVTITKPLPQSIANTGIQRKPNRQTASPRRRANKPRKNNNRARNNGGGRNTRRRKPSTQAPRVPSQGSNTAAQGQFGGGVDSEMNEIMARIFGMMQNRRSFSSRFWGN